MNKQAAQRIAGSILILAGIAVNKWTLAPLADDGVVGFPANMLLLLLFQLPAIFLGLLLLAPKLLLLPGSMPPAIANTLILAVTLTYALVLADLALREWASPWIFAPKPRAFVGEFENRESRTFVTDPATGWRMRSNTKFRWSIDGHSNVYRANVQGFRSSRDFDASGPHHRIALIGDSFAFGTGVDVEQTFGAQLQKRLGNQVLVDNYAMPGFALDQMWMSVRHQALPTNPVLIIVAFIDNDLDRSLTAYRRPEGFNKPTFQLEDGTLRPQTRDDRPTLILDFLENNSAIWAGIRHAVKTAGYSASVGEWWRHNAAILKAMMADCRQGRVPVLFVRLPTKEWIEFRSLRRLMDAQNANFIDLGSPRIRPDYPVHFQNDGHLNGAGHTFVARAIAAWMSKTGILPDTSRNR